MRFGVMIASIVLAFIALAQIMVFSAIGDLLPFDIDLGVYFGVVVAFILWVFASILMLVSTRASVALYVLSGVILLLAGASWFWALVAFGFAFLAHYIARSGPEWSIRIERRVNAGLGRPSR